VLVLALSRAEEAEDLAEDRAREAYLSQLRTELGSLERFPASSYPQLTVLVLTLGVFLVGATGVMSLPVPGYLLLPFFLVPGGRLARQELRWRETHRRLSGQIRLLEERASRAVESRDVRR